MLMQEPSDLDSFGLLYMRAKGRVEHFPILQERLLKSWGELASATAWFKVTQTPQVMQKLNGAYARFYRVLMEIDRCLT